MRKKYLSALLFGALLFASAGTFTSCKDYDDDINNLQSQITANADAIKALQELVNSGKYVSGVAMEGQTITFTFSDGSTQAVVIPEGEKGQTVVVENNELYIDGEPTGIKVAETATAETGLVKAENGTWWVLGEDGEYTNTNIPVSGVTVSGSEAAGFEFTIYTENGKQTVKLPTAASTITKLTVIDNLSFGFESKGKTDNSDPIVWGYGTQTDDMKNWKGPKGAVSTNQLMIGQIGKAVAAVEVSPASVDLGAQELALYDSKGNKAPVVVKAVANYDNLALDNSRAASANGKWNLVLTIDETVNKDNIKTTFDAYDYDGQLKSKLYALAVNGVVMTGYNIVINTNATNSYNANGAYTYESSNLSLNSDGEKGTGTNAVTLKPGKTTTFTYSDDECYDAYLSFEGTMVAKAAALGIKVDGMNMTIPSTAINLTGDLKVTLHAISVNGHSFTQEIGVMTTGATTEDQVELSTVNYKVTPKLTEIKVDMSKAFEGMTDAQIEAVDLLTHISFAEPLGQNNFLLDNAAAVKYYASNNTEITNLTGRDLRDISYIKFTVDNNVATDAKPGDYKVIMTMYNKPASDDEKSEVRKVTIPVSVSLPTFDDLFSKVSSTDVWANGESTLRMQKGMTLDYTIAFATANGSAFDSNFSVKFDNVNNKNVLSNISQGKVTLNSENIIYQNKLISNKLGTEITYKIDGKEGLAVKSDKFTTNVLTMFEGAKLVYYKDNATIEKAQAAYTEGKYVITPMSKDSNDKKQGLAIQFANSEESFVNTDITFNNVKLNAISASFAKPTDNVNRFYTVDGLGEGVTAGHDNDGVVIGGSYNGQSATLVVNCWDSNNIKTSFTIPFEAVVK